MPAQETTPVVKCDNVVVSSRGIAEVHGKKAVIFVPAAEIESITLKFGQAEHRPVMSLTIGVVLALIGIFGLVELVLAPRGIRYELGMMALGAIGGSLIFDALKQRYFLEVRKKQGSERLVFSKQAQLKEIQDFCQQAGTVYKHPITEEV